MLLIKDINFISPKPSAVALGAFDGVHLGHRAVICAAVEAAEKEGLIPAVFTFSGLPKSAPGAWALTGYEEKARLIEGLGAKLMLAPDFTEEVRSIDAERFVSDVLIGRLKARHIFCGADHRFGAGAKGGAELLKRVASSFGAAVTVLEPVTMNGERISSTRIRALLAEGRVETARELLGHEI